jgi:uncharacterized protein (DUF433 family)
LQLFLKKHCNQTEYKPIKIAINTKTKVSMTLKDLEPELLALSPSEKAQAIQLLVRSLSNVWQGIEKTSGVCGGDARIANTRIPIWSLVNYRRLDASDARILQDFPHLKAEDLVNAWGYADAHSEEIEAAIRRNEEIS